MRRGLACAVLLLIAGGRIASADAIADFWFWWASARPRYEVKGIVSLVQQAELAAHVKAIDPGLAWEIGGVPGSRRLTVSPEGDFKLRRLTARWAKAAPRTAGWTYAAARTRETNLDYELELGGVKLALRDLRFAAVTDNARSRIDVVAHHPRFARAPEEAVRHMTFLALDSLLGEDDVESYVGTIETSTGDAPAGALDAPALRAAVDALKKKSSSSERTFSVAQGRDPTHPEIHMLDLGLKRLDHLEHEWHLEVTIPFREPKPDGFPQPEEYRATADLEDALCAALGKDGLYYGHSIGGGKLAVFFYAPRMEPVDAVLASWLALHADRKPSREWTHDPEWARFRRW